jgi:hypothetical protein
LRKLHLVILISSLTLSACLPTFLQPTDGSQNTDTQATIAAGLTLAAQTLQIEATPTLAFPSATRAATRTATLTRTASAVPTTPAASNDTPTATTFATFTTGTAVTPTNVTGTPGTPFLATATSGSPTSTLFPQFFGTQPPDIPFGLLTLINTSKSEVYISLQCKTSNGQVSILEYPVRRRLGIRAPAGTYIYVAWVGGKKMSGHFSLGKAAEKTITIFKDRIVIK